MKRLPLERLLDKTRRDASGCLVWTGGKNTQGYARFWDGTRLVLAHRWLYEQCTRRGLGDRCLLHRCDNPACVEPAHMFEGTHTDNMRDMQRKLRAGNRRLTPDIVRELRRQRGKVTQRELARRYGTSHALVGYAQRGVTWAWVD